MSVSLKRRRSLESLREMRRTSWRFRDIRLKLVRVGEVEEKRVLLRRRERIN
jgi:hypothetical protein